MHDRWDSLLSEHVSLESLLSDPAVLGDQSRLREVSRRYKELTPVVECIRRIESRSSDAEAARELIAMTDDAVEREQLKAEKDSAEADIARLEEELKTLLLPKDPNDGRPVIMEIRGAEGGEEANLFARDLYEMYVAYASRRGWKVETLSVDPSDLGGVNQATFVVRGDDAWSRLKFEGGPHRVQRVPVTESQGRIHTSSATVMVLPEAEEVDVHIDDKDLQIDVYRASGPGGQGVNTTDSAVRITHIPTGVVVTMQDERSQLQNRARAMTVLRSRLLKQAQDEMDAKMSAERRSQVGGGGRGEKIRTYNFKENRLTDHRIGFTIYSLGDVLAGDLDGVIDALATDERSRQLAGDRD
ncbi:MAG: peptide chain release factor 1 [Ilumatobacteraceae bacterium]|jgi:peptide chain release factor 1|nr:peptide chain release factor 1 [Actinomycetota bacterium]NDA76225.1 peptide chain release factor 1 [Actinomycetota bacterium]NDD97659.1 peptide chain release factor 1 [Actinomycetota bacterium]NDE59762.1 peptide chain release factor 1 [Acidimicrobiia bacterium]NDE79705.1 peptide chain release factor 1 [Actinomycetota bacterium]